jgi:dihydroorotate dehydrogenase|tara:strand:- start:991 stop:1203 length:213 start_codon:yes stop_codon:yes gene_type:complete
MEADHALRKVTCDEMTTKKEMAVRRGIGYTLGSVGGISIVYDGAQRLGVGATAVTLGAGLMLHRMGVLSQ